MVRRLVVDCCCLRSFQLCGDWAGLPDLLQQTCPPLEADKTCYTTYVINEGTAYDQAYVSGGDARYYLASRTA
jgi:hypothetical protein